MKTSQKVISYLLGVTNMSYLLWIKLSVIAVMIDVETIPFYSDVTGILLLERLTESTTFFNPFQANVLHCLKAALQRCS